MMLQQFRIRSNCKKNLAITAAQEPSTNRAHNTTADGNKQATVAMLLSPQDVLKKGFHFFNGLPNFAGPWTERHTNDFKIHYGSLPIVLANQWYDLMTTKLNVGLTKADKSDKGFKIFLVLHHFLWAYPKNPKFLVLHFR
jgi:hypothetical protein